MQRLARNINVNMERCDGLLGELGIRKGWTPKDWGWGSITDKQWGHQRLITVYDRDAKEPWFLVSNLPEEFAAEIVRLYKRRMWIEALFRDLKNSNWGLGMDKARLTAPGPNDWTAISLFSQWPICCSSPLGPQPKQPDLVKNLRQILRVRECFP